MESSRNTQKFSVLGLSGMGMRPPTLCSVPPRTWVTALFGTFTLFCIWRPPASIGEPSSTYRTQYCPMWVCQLALVVRNLPAYAGGSGDTSSIPGLGGPPGGGHGNPLQSSLPGESHGRTSLVGYGPQGRRESDTQVTWHEVSSMYPGTYPLPTRKDCSISGLCLVITS